MALRLGEPGWRFVSVSCVRSRPAWRDPEDGSVSVSCQTSLPSLREDFGLFRSDVLQCTLVKPSSSAFRTPRSSELICRNVRVVLVYCPECPESRDLCAAMSQSHVRVLRYESSHETAGQRGDSLWQPGRDEHRWACRSTLIRIPCASFASAAAPLS